MPLFRAPMMPATCVPCEIPFEKSASQRCSACRFSSRLATSAMPGRGLLIRCSTGRTSLWPSRTLCPCTCPPASRRNAPARSRWPVSNSPSITATATPCPLFAPTPPDEDAPIAPRRYEGCSEVLRDIGEPPPPPPQAARIRAAPETRAKTSASLARRRRACARMAQ